MHPTLLRLAVCAAALVSASLGLRADVLPAFAAADYVATTESPSLDEASIRLTLHVAAASDTPSAAEADGSAARPFPSILAARPALHDALRAGTPVRLRIGPGTYREDLRQLVAFRPEDGEAVRDTLLVIEGSAPGEVIVSGSVERIPGHDFALSTWRRVPGQKGLLMRDWPFEGNVDPGPWIDSYGHALLPGLMQRSEMIWLNGRPLRPVLTELYRWVDPDGRRGYSDRGTGQGGDKNNQPGKLVYDRALVTDLAALSTPGTFAVFTDPAAPAELRGRVFLRLPEGLAPDELNRVEVGLWKGRAWAPLLAVRGKNNLVLRNLVFQHAATGPLASAVTLNSVRNFLIEDCSFSHNVANGLQINQSSVGVLRRLVADHNGANGLGLGEGSSQILVEDCSTSFNNVRGGWSAWNAWHASGSKSGGVSRITFRRHVSIGNYANGLWFDVYCRDILVERSFFLGNKRMGVMFELTRPRGGPHVLRDSVCAFNDNTGLYLSMASNSAAVGNLLVGNGGGGNVEGEPHHTQLLFKVTPHPQGPKSAADWQSVVLRGNTLASADPAASLIDVLQIKAEPLTQFPWVLAVLDSDANTYWTPAPDAAYRRPDGAYLDLAGWRALLAEHAAPGPRDATSAWSDPGLDADPAREFTPDSASAVTARARALGAPLPLDKIRDYWSRTAAGLYAPPHLVLRRNFD